MLKHKYKISALVICLVFFSLALFSVEGFHWNDLKYTGSAITSDELSHIPAGYYYLKTGRYFLNPEHPPLVKDIAALPLLVKNPVLPEINENISLPDEFTKEKFPLISYALSRDLEIGNSQWDWGRVFLFNPANNPDVITFWARLSVIFFNAILLYLLYFFISKSWSRRAGLAGIFLIGFSQFSLGHGSLVTMDFMSSILQMIALVCFAAYLRQFVAEEKSIAQFILAVSFFALALLAKFSSIIIMPAAFIAGLIFIIWQKRSWGWAGKYIVRYALFCLSIFLFIALFYSFHTRNMETDHIIEQITGNYPGGAPQIGSEILSSFAASNNPITKGLAEYLNGMLMVFGRMSDAAQTIYFMGAIYGSEGAGPLYFPILYLTKLSVGFLILNFVGLFFAIGWFFLSKKSLREKISNFLENPLSLSLFVFAYIYLVVALSSTFQIGLRHIMPVIFVITLLTAKFLDDWWDAKIHKSFRAKHFFAVVFVGIFVSVFSAFPYYLSYYNFLGGGTANGYKIATDSNYDWGGQDVKLLAKWVKDNNIQKIYTDVFTNVPLAYYLGDAYENYNIEWWGLPASGSYIAVSAFEYQNNVYNVYYDKIKNGRKYSVLKDNLVARIGTTMFVFRVP